MFSSVIPTVKKTRGPYGPLVDLLHVLPYQHQLAHAILFVRRQLIEVNAIR